MICADCRHYSAACHPGSRICTARAVRSFGPVTSATHLRLVATGRDSILMRSYWDDAEAADHHGALVWSFQAPASTRGASVPKLSRIERRFPKNEIASLHGSPPFPVS